MMSPNIILRPPKFSLSYSRYLTDFGAKCGFAAAACIVIVPRLAEGFHPLMGIVMRVGIVVGLVLSTIRDRKGIVYEISLIYNIQMQQEWCHEISKDVILGAIPCREHTESLKAAGVTHVISLLEQFEQETGIIRPLDNFTCRHNSMQLYQEETPDFQGVGVKTIQKVVAYMEKERAKNMSAKFYIHCKAGRGRSASIVVIDIIQHRLGRKGNHEVVSPEQLVEEAINEVAQKRPQISLNANQRATIVEYTKLLLSQQAQAIKADEDSTSFVEHDGNP